MAVVPALLVIEGGALTTVTVTVAVAESAGAAVPDGVRKRVGPGEARRRGVRDRASTERHRPPFALVALTPVTVSVWLDSDAGPPGESFAVRVLPWRTIAVFGLVVAASLAGTGTWLMVTGQLGAARRGRVGVADGHAHHAARGRAGGERVGARGRVDGPAAGVARRRGPARGPGPSGSLTEGT